MAIRGERGGPCREALHEPAAAGGDAGAKRAGVEAACRPQHEQFFARSHRPKHQYRRSRSARRAGRRLGSWNSGAVSRRWRGMVAHGSHGLLASCRDSRLVLFQALQCRGTTGRHSGANPRIVASARATDRGNVRIARLAGRGRCLRSGRALGSRPGRSRGRLFLGCNGRLRLRLCRSCRWLGPGFRRSSDGAHGALTTRREARHIFLQALQRRHSAWRNAGAMGLIVGAAFGTDRATLGIRRGL